MKQGCLADAESQAKARGSLAAAYAAAAPKDANPGNDLFGSSAIRTDITLRLPGKSGTGHDGGGGSIVDR
jgi:hypothetical protein